MFFCGYFMKRGGSFKRTQLQTVTTHCDYMLIFPLSIVVSTKCTEEHTHICLGNIIPKFDDVY